MMDHTISAGSKGKPGVTSVSVVPTGEPWQAGTVDPFAEENAMSLVIPSQVALILAHQEQQSLLDQLN